MTEVDWEVEVSDDKMEYHECETKVVTLKDYIKNDHYEKA